MATSKSFSAAVSNVNLLMKPYVVPAFLLMAMTLLACQREDERAEAISKAESDARDVAYVESVQKQHAPVQQIELQTLGEDEVNKLKAGPQSCRFFARQPNGNALLFVAGQLSGAVKLEGELLSVAADTGAVRLKAGVYPRYVSKAFWLELTEGDQGHGQLPADIPSALIARDQFDRIIFRASGTLQCRVTS